MTDPIPIMFLIGSLKKGGSEGQLLQLIKGLDRDRYAPQLALFDGSGDEPGRLREEEGVPVHFPKLGPKLIHPSTAEGMAKFAGLMRREKIRIVHPWLDRAIFYGVLSGRMAGVKAIAAAQRNTHFAADARERRMHRFLYGMTNIVIGNSNRVIDEAARCRLAPAAKLKVIYNGVDAERFAPDVCAEEGRALRLRFGVPDNAVLFVQAANFFPVKNHGLTLAAMETLAVRDGLPAHCLFAGDGPERPAMEAEAARRGLKERAHFAGLMADVRPALAAADVCLSTSRREGFSNAILEAMAFGKAVVATDAGGAAESVNDGATGFVVPSDDRAALENAMRTLATDADKRKAMGVAGRARAEKEFSLRAMIAAHEGVYEALLKK